MSALNPTHAPGTNAPNFGAKAIAYPMEMREKAFQLFKAGKTLEAVANAIKVPVTTVQRWSSRCKWRARIAEAESKQASLLVPPPDASGLLDTIGQLTFDEKQGRYKTGMATEALRMLRTVQALPGPMLLAAADKIAKLDAIARKALNLEEARPTAVINVALLARPAITAHILPDSDPLTIERGAGIEPAPAIIEAETDPG